MSKWERFLREHVTVGRNLSDVSLESYAVHNGITDTIK